MTPLHHACKEGRGELAEFLLGKGAEAGAEIVCPGAAGGGAQCTAARLRYDEVPTLHCAAMGGLTALAIRLYEEFQGQPEGKTDKYGDPDGERTPAMCAAKQFNVAAWRSHRAGNHAG